MSGVGDIHLNLNAYVFLSKCNLGNKRIGK